MGTDMRIREKLFFARWTEDEFARLRVMPLISPPGGYASILCVIPENPCAYEGEPREGRAADPRLR